MSENKVKPPRALYFVVASVLILSIVAQWLFLKYGSSNNGQYLDDGISATIVHSTSAVAAFNLSDHNGNDFTQNNLIGKWTMLSFGYTHCPDICPTTLNTLNHVEKILHDKNSSVFPQIVFITLDPERDDVATLADYVPWFNKNFIGVTGDPEQILALTKHLGIMSQKNPDQNEEGDYLIDHTVTIMLTDTRGRLRALTSAPYDAKIIADDFIKITERFD